MTGLPSLETELNRRAEQGEEDARELWARYGSMKAYLSREYYPWIQANSSFLTDHGEQHIRSVIQSASALIKKHLSPRTRDKRTMTSLDLFLILSGILWHDVGNVYERSGHAARVAQMTEKIKEIGFPDLAIHRLVVEIAAAHSGQDGLTKARPEEDASMLQGTYTVYTRSLAGIVRLADEVSENRFRISTELLTTIPDDNRIFWQYAHSVTASRPVPERNRIIITIELQEAVAVEKFLSAEFPSRRDSDGKMHLLDYILCRLEKMNNERAYCSNAFGRYGTIDEIEARFALLNGVNRIRETTVFFGDAGLKKDDPYPNIRIFDDFYEKHPDWKPERLKEELSQ
ncbi:MAG TPA: hypothetical protein VFI24_20200 [Pyrinomonadaceae bacterium]|nr:hypothetical protein [Pyrinomonadaceae bacterium]